MWFLHDCAFVLLHCGSCTVIHGCVCSCQRPQLKVDLISGGVPGDAGSAAECRIVVGGPSVGRAPNGPHPFQSFPWRMPQPGPVVITDLGPRDSTIQSEGLSKLHCFRAPLSQLHTGDFACKQRQKYELDSALFYALGL